MANLGKLDYFYDEAWRGGSSARRRAGRVQDEWSRQGLRPPSEFDDPRDYAAQFDNGFFDEQGFAPTLPGKYTDQDVQYQSERYVAGRNQGLLADAIGMGNRLYGQGRGALQQGISNLQAYRPGGAAAMASGMYESTANMYANQAEFGLRGAVARQINAPDMMQASRDAAIKSANERADRAGLMQLGGQLLGTAFGAMSGGAAGGAGAAVGGGMGAKIAGAIPAGAGGMMGQPVGQSGLLPVQGSGGGIQSGGGGGGGLGGAMKSYVAGGGGRVMGGGGQPSGPGGQPAAGAGGAGGEPTQGAPQGAGGSTAMAAAPGALAAFQGVAANQPYGPATDLVAAASMQPPEMVRSMVNSVSAPRLGDSIRRAMARMNAIIDHDRLGGPIGLYGPADTRERFVEKGGLPWEGPPAPLDWGRDIEALQPR